tara:strand:+ start:2428 stop:2559 length:132 start_codon:yes stop_codon:yes gene_type:complete
VVEEEYYINFDFMIKLSNLEKELMNKMLIEKQNKLFYITNHTI